jgi:integration host factor subunit beta
MTRSDLVEELAARFSQLTHRDAEYAVKTILDAMSDALVRGHRIEIRGFGSFSISRRPPRLGRNPRSGESVQIPEKRVPHFKPGKALREAELAISPAEIEDLIAARLAARAAKDWAESDRIRDELAGMGIAIKDNKDGTTSWEVKR